MDQKLLFAKLISNTLKVDTLIVSSFDDLKAFEEKSCFHRDLQPMLQAESLSYLIESMADDTFYEVNDILGISILLFRYNKTAYIVGPYVMTKIQDSVLEDILLRKKIPSSFLLPLKLHYTSLPVISSFYVQSLISGIITSFDDKTADYKYRRLHGLENEIATNRLYEEQPPDYSEIYARYERENNLLNTIRSGDLNGLVNAYNEITKESNIQFIHQKDNPSYQVYSQDYMVGAATIRALVRKAAEEGGLSVIKIDEITQKYAQIIASNAKLPDISKYNYNLIYELTDEVRKLKLSGLKLSQPIAKVMEYLSLNYGKEISLSQLTEIANFSEAHLSKEFKKETGQTISQCITDFRLSKASHLLKTTNLSIQEISMYVGYPDNNYFVKVFKKKFGQTPSDYRKSKN